ncbi:hypothetical protein [uncultured Psychroserpens sp.]|uniref:hypothetical protein n=1 Tax=uncultured Psychroserpens sp. TaxID=255436 RepID=UPI002604F04F|nr:hypothetical protein [uncultured Psychroserpens sp.]
MKSKNIAIGLIVGLISSALGLLLALKFFGSENSIYESLQQSIRQGVLTKLVSIGALLNLAIFFLFINKKQDLKAKGVLIATVLVAVVTIIVRFIK